MADMLHGSMQQIPKLGQFLHTARRIRHGLRQNAQRPAGMIRRSAQSLQRQGQITHCCLYASHGIVQFIHGRTQAVHTGPETVLVIFQIFNQRCQTIEHGLQRTGRIRQGLADYNESRVRFLIPVALLLQHLGDQDERLPCLLRRNGQILHTGFDQRHSRALLFRIFGLQSGDQQLHTLGEPLHCLARIGPHLVQAVLRVIDQCHDLAQVAGGISHRIHGIGQGSGGKLQTFAQHHRLLQHRQHLLQRILQQQAGPVEFIRQCAAIFTNIAGQLLQCSAGTADMLYRIVQMGTSSTEVIHADLHLPDQRLQFSKLVFQLLQMIFIQIQRQIGFHLAHDTTHILTALDGSPVGAAGNSAAAAASDATHIITDVGITDGSRIDTIIDRTDGIAGDAAGIHHGHTGGQSTGVHQHAQVNGGKVQRRIGGVDVDAGQIFTALYQTHIVAGDATSHILAHHQALADTAQDAAASLVDTGNAANTGAASHCALKTATNEQPAVASDDATNSCRRSSGSNPARDCQIPDQALPLHIAKQTCGGALLGQFQTGDGMPPALKGTAKGGNARKGHTR